MGFMTALSCPACGLLQTLAAPRCARCGAQLGGPAPAPFVPPTPAAAGGAPNVAAVDDRTVLRDALPMPPAEPASNPDHTAAMPAQFGSHPVAPEPPGLTWTPGAPPPQPTAPSLLQRIWWRIIGEPAAATQDPPGDAPRESPGR